jgi:hypothetical protein
VFKKRFKYNRIVQQSGNVTPFSRIQCFGVVDEPLSPAAAAAADAKEVDNAKLVKMLYNKQYKSEPHKTLRAFWLPASTILQNMQRFFRSSSAFEQSKWEDAKAYNKYCQFTNFMLLNLCREVIRQISTMFRIQDNDVALQEEEKQKETLLMPIDALLEPNLYSEWNLPTQVELILGHAEPRNWMPPVSVNLQRFLSANLQPSATNPEACAATPLPADDQAAAATSPAWSGSPTADKSSLAPNNQLAACAAEAAAASRSAAGQTSTPSTIMPTDSKLKRSKPARTGPTHVRLGNYTAAAIANVSTSASVSVESRLFNSANTAMILPAAKATLPPNVSASADLANASLATSSEDDMR